MLNEWYETRVWQLQHELNDLEAQHGELWQAARLAEDELDRASAGTRFWDRHLPLVWLKGDRVAYDRIHPLRRSKRQYSRQALRVEPRLAAKENEIMELVRKGLKHCDPKYRAILGNQDKAKKARESCVRMHELVAAASRRIEAAQSSAVAHPRDEPARAGLDRDADDVTRKVTAVRQHGPVVNRKAGSYGKVDAKVIKNLPLKFSGSRGDLKVRIQEFTHAASLLDAVDKDVESLLGAIAKQEKVLEEERLRYLKTERARFTGGRPPVAAEE